MSSPALAQSRKSTTYTLSTAKGAVSQFNLEKALGLDSGILDSTNGNENATEGSAVSAVFVVKSGDILTFDYFFQGGDYLPTTTSPLFLSMAPKPSPLLVKLAAMEQKQVSSN